MQWDIKSDINYNNTINSDNYPYHKNDDNSNYSNNTSYEKARNDIFPNNYYKITESVKNENIKENKEIKNTNDLILNSTDNVIEQKDESEKVERRDSVFTNTNLIENDISQSHINSYKLRIYKRFIKDGVLSSSSITYNFITTELRFNTKGITKEILYK